MSKQKQYSLFFDENKLKSFHTQTPFFVFNPQAILSNVKEYKDYLPQNTEICYAMKANSEKPVLQTLNRVGSSFEVASKYELSLLKSLKISSDKIIYGNPIKPTSHIRSFVEYGVNRFAFDSEQELLKIAKYSPKARVYVRVLVDHKSDSVFSLSKKFGAPLKDAVALLLKAQELGLVPYGISFNVGSQARNEYAWARGLSDIAKAMKLLLKKNIKIHVVNFGGGFPHSYQESDNIPPIRKILSHINFACKELPYKVNFIVEPGRGLVANAFVLVTNIIEKNKRQNGYWLYADAGVYNALFEALAKQGSIRYHVVSLSRDSSTRKKQYILTGPTCDDLDVVNRTVLLPSDIQSGDKLIIYDTGAYSFPLTTRFNGFPKPKTIIL